MVQTRSEDHVGRRLRFRDLQVFFAVAQSGSMAKAASQLGITQPAVSDIIAGLEHMFAARLFDRSPQGVEPTMYGRALLKRGLAAFDEVKQGIRDLDFLADPTTGNVRLGSPGTIIATILLPIIQRFRQQHPRVNLHVEDSISLAHEIAGLRDRKFDFALGRLVSPHASLGDDLKTELLFEDPLVVVVGMQTRWARRRKIDLAELIDEPWTLPPPQTLNYECMAEAFRKRGCDMPKIGLVSFSVHLRTQLVASGQFITALPKSIADQYSLKVLPIQLTAQPWSVAIFTLKNRTLSPVVERFIEHVRDVTQPMRVARPTRAGVISRGGP
jgi:DNA-binding transcriptional LysR family regulator